MNTESGLGWVYDDGGRSKYFRGSAGDCVCRAAAIASGRDYKEVYDLINMIAKSERTGSRKRGISSARAGVYRLTERQLFRTLGFEWHPTMLIGSGCKTHMRKGELPKGTIVCSVSKHLVCVMDGVAHDTSDCSRDGDRCVYGYYARERGGNGE